MTKKREDMVLRKLFSQVGVLFVFLALAGSSPASDLKSIILEKKTLTRTEDFVVVYGKSLRQSLNENIEQLGLFAFREGKLEPIPFQIDEINKEGEWVLTQVPPTLAGTGLKPERDEDDGNLDENDELAFMIRDAGDRVSFNGLPTGVEAIDEITLRDPANSGRAWVYLLSFRENPPLSKNDYVDYRSERNQVVAKNYTLGFDPKMSIAPSLLSLQGSPNLIDRMKIRLSSKIMGIPFGFDESELVSRLSLYKDGPIRVIRRTRSAIQFNWMFRTPSAAVENIYYDNTMVIPIRVRIPFSIKSASSLISYIRVRGTADLQNTKNCKIKVDTDPRWMTLDGKMDETEKSIKGEGSTWFLASTPEGAFMIRMIMNRNPDGSFQKSPIKTRLYYVDDDNTPDPPESVPGQSPQVGWWMEGLPDLEKGTLYFFAIMYLMKDYSDGVENNYLKILDQPVEISIN